VWVNTTRIGDISTGNCAFRVSNQRSLCEDANTTGTKHLLM
jgi:hypothetical protein